MVNSFTALEAIVTILSSLIIVLLGVQINQTLNLKKTINAVKENLANHILQMTQMMAKKVDTVSCVDVRRECFALNKTIIQNPLQDQLEEMKTKDREHRHKNEKEYAILWEALRKHSHTKIEDSEHDKVIFNNGNRA